MKTFNITAQVYDISDSHKQTILLNKEIQSTSEQQAIDIATNLLSTNFKIIKIYSAEII